MAAFFMHVRTLKLLKGAFLSYCDDIDNDYDIDANPLFLIHLRTHTAKGDFLHGVYPAFTLRLRLLSKVWVKKICQRF